jgi:SAM-dependent methyltransferase
MTNKLSLEQISLNYRSDKGSVYHGYLDIYEKYFSKYRNTLNNFLEIGLWEGESLRMWREYFTVGNLVGADILDLSHIKLPDTSIHICDQSDRDQLQNLVDKTFNQFDIIIDDGGHWQHQQQITLGHIFKYLSPKGIFVIEDLHTANNPAYTRPGDVSTLDILNQWKETGKLFSNCMTQGEIDYLEKNVLEINIEKALVSDIAFIIKK